jgi:cell division protein FtsX
MAARALRGKRTGALLGLGLAPAAVAALFLLITLPRLTVRATFAQYHGDFGTEPVSATPLGYALAWMLTVVLCAVGWTANALGQLSRRS